MFAYARSRWQWLRDVIPLPVFREPRPKRVKPPSKWPPRKWLVSVPGIGHVRVADCRTKSEARALAKGRLLHRGQRLPVDTVCMPLL